MKYTDKIVDKLFREGSRESKLLAGRIIVAAQARDTHLWKLRLMQAVRNGTPWPRLDEDTETMEAKIMDEAL